MNHDLELKLQAWLDGELDQADAAEIRRLLAVDSEAAALQAQLQFSKAALLHNEQPRAVPDTREFYWSKIERQIRHEEQAQRDTPVSWAARFRRIIAPLAGVAALAGVLVFALNQRAPEKIAFDEVSTTVPGMEARTIRDQSDGMTIVYFQDTQKAQIARPIPNAVHTRNDGSSFEVEME